MLVRIFGQIELIKIEDVSVIDRLGLKRVRFELAEKDIESYRRAADFLGEEAGIRRRQPAGGQALWRSSFTAVP